MTQGKVKRVWDIKHSTLLRSEPIASPLESDARNRKDVVYLRAGDQIKSQDSKHSLEEQQRKDRRLRKEGGGFVEH